jgi:hypothetical protein
MTVAIALILALLACAVVVLFAMLGELSSRLPVAASASQHGAVWQPDGLQRGAPKSSWPPPLLPLRDANSALLLVFSPVCKSCNAIASELPASVVSPDPAFARLTVAVLVAAQHEPTGYDFLRRHDLRGLPHYVDVGGAWVSDNFGIHSSPAALFFHAGSLMDGYIYTDINTLHREVVRRNEQSPEYRATTREVS